MGLPKKRTDDLVGVNILLTPQQHTALKLIGALRGETLGKTVGRLSLEEAEREHLPTNA